MLEIFGLPTPNEFASYIDAARPVVIRGAAGSLFTQKDYLKFEKHAFLSRFGPRMSPVGDLPYIDSFQSDGGVREITVSEFVESFTNDTNARPLYMFSSDFPRRNPEFRDMCSPLSDYLSQVNTASGGLATLVYPLDPSIHFGGPGSGAPIHHHNIAVNVQFYGKKRWMLYPRGKGYRSKVAANTWLREKHPELSLNATDGALGTLTEVITYGGDVLIVPKDWAHGTLTIEAGIAIALEMDYNPLNCNEFGAFGT
jgi:hypothetical protein